MAIVANDQYLSMSSKHGLGPFRAGLEPFEVFELSHLVGLDFRFAVT